MILTLAYFQNFVKLMSCAAVSIPFRRVREGYEIKKPLYTRRLSHNENLVITNQLRIHTLDT